MPKDEVGFGDIEATLKRSAAALKEADVPFVLGGSLAVFARGGPESCSDLDLIVKPEDAERALDVLLALGMRQEHPPEDWLLKAWDADVLVDLIFAPVGLRVDDRLFETADRMNVVSIHMPVMRLEDVFATKLMSLNDHYLDYAGLLKLVRAVREQIDWDEVRARTRSSPYARAFFALLEELDIVPARHPAAASEAGRAHVRVVPG
jgi:putative nucleotidyltransferase-like protein